MSSVIKIVGEISAPDSVDADAFLEAFGHFLRERHCSFGGSIEDSCDDSCGGATHEHFHCDLCGSRFDTSDEAGRCFEEHTKEEHLEWVAQETYYLETCSRELFEKIGFIHTKYQLG